MNVSLPTRWLYVRVPLQLLSITLASSKEILDIPSNAKDGLTLKHECVIIKAQGQMHCTDEYSQRSSILWPLSLNCCELSGCRFESPGSYLNSRYRACFKHGVPWHSGNYRVQIRSKTCMWHAKYMQSNTQYM